MNTEYQIKVTIPSIDWITGTANSDRGRATIAEIAHEYLNQQIELGFEPRAWKSYQYEGWRINGASWGKRASDDIITFSGEISHFYWKPLVAYLDTCSRLDLAVTQWYTEHDINLASKYWQDINRRAGSEAITRRYTYITNLLGGDTIYVGSRSSQAFGRIYDKAMQSLDEHFANAWRWEVELHKPIALVVLKALDSAEDEQNTIIAQVKTWFEDRLIRCPFEPKQDTIDIVVPRKRKTRDEQTIEWLEGQVSGSVKKLAERGKISQVLEALGLVGYADELYRKKTNQR